MTEEHLRNLGITLPPVPKPVGIYRGVTRIGNILFVSGHGPRRPDQSFITGKVPTTCTVEQARDAARLAGINMLATIKAELGSLDRVCRIAKVLGMVNAEPDFAEHPKVIDGFSELMVEVFGERGLGSRSAVGFSSLPSQIPVEVEMILEVE